MEDDIEFTLGLPRYQRHHETVVTSTLNQESWYHWSKLSSEQTSNDRIGFYASFPTTELKKLENAIMVAIGSHSALRSGLFVRKGNLAVKCLDPSRLKIVTCNAEDLTDTALKADITEFGKKAIPVNGKWPLRIKLYDRTRGPVCAVYLNHIVADRHSIYLLKNDIYRVLKSLPPRGSSVSYFDYATHQRAWFNSSSGYNAVKYWLNWLTRQNALYAPVSHKLLIWRPGKRKRVRFFIDAHTQAKVANLAVRFKSTPFFIYFAAFVISISLWSGEKRFPIRINGSLRTEPAFWFMVGNMITAQIMECDLSGFSSFENFLHVLKDGYNSVSQIQMPSIFNFCGHPKFSGLNTVKLGGAAAATINYFSTREQTACLDMGRNAEIAWPPKILSVEEEEWKIPLWPLYLRMSESSTGIACAFEFNSSLVSSDEQNSLISCFFGRLDSVLAS